MKTILRVTPSKRPSIREILENPYFSEEDTASTKESELESSRMQKQLPQPYSQKVQQNSYPMYAPKVQAHSPLKPEPLQRPLSNGAGLKGALHTPTAFKPASQPKQGLNHTFTGQGHGPLPQVPAYRRS